MKTIKKSIIIVTVIVMIASLVIGCEKASGEKIKIAIVLPMDHLSLNEIKDTIVSELKNSDIKDKIEIIEKNANGDMSMLPSIMQQLVADKTDIIIPIATPTAQAAKPAIEGTDVKMVFSAVSSPVEAGLVAALDATDANITGVSDFVPVEDIFELARVLTPNAGTFGFVYNTSEVNSITKIQKAKAYCDANNIKYKEASVSATADVQQAALSLVGSVDAFFTPDDNTVASAMTVYSQIAIENKIPLYAGADSMVKEGALATVGISYTVLGKQTAAMAIRIVKGEAVADNPVEIISEYAKMININTANQIGIQIPQSLESDFVKIEE